MSIINREPWWSKKGECPVCCNTDGFWEGEYVNVEVGMVQVTPDECHVCGYIQASSYRDGDLPIEYFAKCWELQVQP